MRTGFFNNYLFLILLLLLCNKSYGQKPNIFQDSINNNIYSVVDSLIKKGHQNEMFPGVSAALFKKDSTQYYNYGYAKIESQVAVSKQTKFQLGSVGKLMTAIAVLQQVDNGKLDLNADISEYIRDIGLEFKYKDNPVTLHCLLTHSCGFNDVNIGYMVRDVKNILPLEEYVKQSNPGLFQPPGTDINYSNFSYAIAGLIIEKVVKSKFEVYVSENIFQLLGMNNTSLYFPTGYESDDNYAGSYRKTNNEFVGVQIYPRHAIPAGSLVSTAEDMSKFVKALFNQDSKLLSADSWNLFYTQQFTNHSLLNGYSYGLEHQNINDVEAWAKVGGLPGVLSNILIVPGEFGFFSVVNTSDDSFGEYFFKAIFDATHPYTIAPKQMKKELSTKKYAGEYRSMRYNRNTEENIVSLFRDNFRVWSNLDSDTLRVFHNGKFHSYVPIDDGIFQNVELPYEHLIFKEDGKGNVVTMYRNLNIGGVSVPISYEKTKWYNSPNFINEYYGFVPVTVFSGLLLTLASLFIGLVRIWKKEFFGKRLLPLRFHILFSTTIILVILHTFMGPFYLLKNALEFLLGYPLVFKVASVIGYLLLPLAIGLAIVLWQIWKDNLGSVFSRFYITIVEASLLIHLAFLFYWNFL